VCGELEVLGFEPATRLRMQVYGPPPLRDHLWLWRHSRDGLYAVLRFTLPPSSSTAFGESPLVVDLWYPGLEASGVSHCLTDDPMRLTQTPAWLRRDVRPEASLAERFARLQRAVPSHGGDQLTPEEFVAWYEQQHAAEMDWHFERGGASHEEIASLARLFGLDAYSFRFDRISHLVREAFLEGYRDGRHEHEQEQLARWYVETHEPESGPLADPSEQRLVFVHDELTAEQAMELCGFFHAASLLPAPDEWYREATAIFAQSEGPREAFAKLASLMPYRDRVVWLDEIADPMVADVYAVPTVEQLLISGGR